MAQNKYIIGNWKMNGSAGMTNELLRGLIGFMAANAKANVEMAVCPPAIYIPVALTLCDGTRVGIGGQDCHPEMHGAFTGDIAAPMLREAGCAYVLVGHSERRQYHAESDELINKKAVSAQKAGLIPVLCIGETLQEREAGKTLSVLSAQLKACLKQGVSAENLIVAYEPVWAIGTGKNATKDDIVSAHSHIGQELRAILGSAGEKVAILYGGSVKAANAAEILSQPGVHGVLVGGASLKTEEFCAIYACA